MNCGLKWRRGKVKMRIMQRKRHKLWPGQFGFATGLPAVCSRPQWQVCWLHFTVCGPATVLSLPSSHVLPWCSVTMNASFCVPNVCVCVCRQSVSAFSEVVPATEQRKDGWKWLWALLWHSRILLCSAAALPPWLRSSRALVNVLCPQCVVAYTPALQECFSLQPWGCAGSRSCSMGERRGAPAVMRRGGTHTLRCCHDGCIHPGEVEEVEKLVMRKGACMHMFGKAQGMSSTEIATLSEYNHINTLCPKTTWAMTYH